MLGAYGWAFLRPIRKLYYNITITAVSVVVAVLIGGVETLGLIGGAFKLEGPFWNAISSLNDNFGALGYLIIGVFAGSWLVSALIYRAMGYDSVGSRRSHSDHPPSLALVRRRQIYAHSISPRPRFAQPGCAPAETPRLPEEARF